MEGYAGGTAKKSILSTLFQTLKITYWELSEQLKILSERLPTNKKA
jgi:hypothetical protein